MSDEPKLVIGKIHQLTAAAPGPVPGSVFHGVVSSAQPTDGLYERIAELERQLSTALADSKSWEAQADDRAADAVRFAEQARTARADALREAADRCDLAGSAAFGRHEAFEDGCDYCRDAIRALIPPSPQEK